jgi:RNA polymerase sigma factor (sigma-70 family)
VAQLPAAQRDAVDLWCEGFTYRQIAEIAGHSEGNVRVLVHRAIKQLRQKLKVTV